MLKKTKSIISVLFTLLKFTIIKIARFNEFEFRAIERFSPGTMVNIWRGGKLVLGEKVRAHTGTKLSVTPNGCLAIGDNTKFNYNCIVVARECIEIGKGVEFGPNVLIYDHDHDFRVEGGLKAGLFKTAPVIIGDNSWIGAGTIILRGSQIGKNCVIGAGCVVSDSIPDNTVLIQERFNKTKQLSSKIRNDN